MVSVFNAGPSKLHDSVLKKIQEELLDYNGIGMSVLEISHRSPDFSKIIDENDKLVRQILEIPENYRVLWLQGGATGQFSAVPLNLISNSDEVADYIVTGTWSKAAAKEAEKFTNVHYVLPPTSEFTGVPSLSEFNFSPNSKYVHYCDNETVVGVEFPDIVSAGGRTLVCDMSSNIMTRSVDVSKFGIIYAGVQKNLAPAGLVLVIIREDLLEVKEHLHPVPKLWDYGVQAAAKSVSNTPNVFSIYCCNLAMKEIIELGGMSYFENLSKAKSSLVYDIVDDSSGFYFGKIEKDSRSRTNITFNLKTPELEATFVKEATSKGLVGLKGHRSVGGIRASLYNAVTLDDTKKLCNFMKEFMAQHA